MTDEEKKSKSFVVWLKTNKFFKKISYYRRIRYYTIKYDPEIIPEKALEKELEILKTKLIVKFVLLEGD